MRADALEGPDRPRHPWVRSSLLADALARLRRGPLVAGWLEGIAFSPAHRALVDRPQPPVHGAHEALLDRRQLQRLRRPIHLMDGATEHATCEPLAVQALVV